MKTEPGFQLWIVVPTGMGSTTNIRTPGHGIYTADSDGYIEFTYTPTRKAFEEGTVTISQRFIEPVNHGFGTYEDITFTILSPVIIASLWSNIENNETLYFSGSLSSVSLSIYDGLDDFLSDKIVALEIDPSNDYSTRILKNESSVADSLYIKDAADCLDEIPEQLREIVEAMDDDDVDDYLFDLYFDDEDLYGPIYMQFVNAEITLEMAKVTVLEHMLLNIDRSIITCMTQSVLATFE